MRDGRARELLRQERASFEQAHRHGEAWFRLRLWMGYLALAAMVAVLLAALWVVLHPAVYGTVPVTLASASMTGQVLALSFGVIRLVLGGSGHDRVAAGPRAGRPADVPRGGGTAAPRP